MSNKPSRYLNPRQHVIKSGMTDDKRVVPLLEEIRDIQKESFTKNEKYRRLTLKLFVVFFIIILLPVLFDILV